MHRRMKVVISVKGRFHAFDLAQQVNEQGCLAQLFTTYPKFVAERWGLSGALVSSFPFLEILNRGCSKLPERVYKWLDIPNVTGSSTDYFVARALENFAPDVFVGWSGSSLNSLKRAKQIGAKTVVERGSCHIELQTQLLKDEYEKWGLTFDKTSRRVRERECAEYETADRITIPSCFARSSFEERGVPFNRIIHVSYGVDLKSFEPVARKDSETFRVMYCGGMTFRKGIPYLLEAFTNLRLKKAELWLVGGMSAEIKQFLDSSDLSLKNVFFKGSFPQNELKWYYSQCDVFVLPSIEDGFGMVIPQAMACGLPVIHTTNTGGRDIVRGSIDGFEIPIRSVESLMEKIEYMYRNRERCREMGESARDRAQSAFTWKDYGDAMIKAYDDLIKSNV